MARLSIHVVGVVGLAVLGCTPRSSSEAEAAAGSESQLMRTAHTRVKPWTDEEASKARDELRSRITADTFKGPYAPASPEYVRTGRREFSYQTFSFQVPADTEEMAAERVEIHDLILPTRPRVLIEPPSTLTVEFETLVPIRSAKLYVGALVPGVRFRKPVFRTRLDYELDAPATTHRLTYRLSKLLSAGYDIQNVGARGRGLLAFRLEVQVPAFVRSGNTIPGRVYVEDGRVAFRCLKTPCDPTEGLLQLPTIALGPMVDLVTPTSATLTWLTDKPTLGRVLVRDSAGRESSFFNSVASRRHEIALESLQPDQAYRYLVVSCDVRGECVDERAGTFATPGRRDAQMRFAVMSDSRAASGTPMSAYQGVNREVIEQLFAVATQREIDFAIFAGDLITGYVTQEAEYRRQIMAWQEAVEPFAMHVPVYEGIGNHEFLGDAWASGWLAGRSTGKTSETVFAELVVNPKNAPAARKGEPSLQETVFSFDRGVVHFAALNSNYFFRNHLERDDHPAKDRGGYREGWITDEQLAWLDTDLAAARNNGATHLFVFTHEPAFPNGGHVQDAMWYRGRIPEVLARRDAFLEILFKHDVLAVFFGDEHNYSRTRIDSTLDPRYAGRLWQIITGGAGAPYYARDLTVPWAGNVESFEPVHHVVVVDIQGEDVWLRAVTTQGETVDAIELTAKR
ncbi:MAG: metallophosphoesterase [Myxococcota bacterium]